MSGGLQSQALIAELLYTSETSNVEVTNVIPANEDQEVVFGVIEGLGGPTTRFSIVEYDLVSGDEGVTDLTGLVPDTLADVQLKIIADQIAILGVKRNNGDSIWIGFLNENYAITEEHTIAASPDDDRSLIWLVNLNQFEDRIMITGQLQPIGSNLVRTYSVEVSYNDTLSHLRSAIFDGYMAVRDVVHVEDYWLMDHFRTYKLYDDGDEWVRVRVPALDFTGKSVNFSKSQNNEIFVTGEFNRNTVFQRGNIVMKLDENLNCIVKDSLFLSVEMNSATFNSMRALTYSLTHDRLYTGGSTEITDLVSGQLSTDPSKIYIAGYDFDLNNEFVYTYQAPQYYFSFDTKVVAPNIIASSGLTYSPVKELFQGYILLFAEDELVSSREQPLPERATLVSPNPSAGEFQFIWDGEAGRPASFKVYSGLGQLVREGDVSLGQSIDLTGSAPGVYYLLVEIGDKVLTQRLMVR